MDNENVKAEVDVTEVNAGMVARGGQLILDGDYENGIKLVNAGTTNLLNIDKATAESQKREDEKSERTEKYVVDITKSVAPAVITGGMATVTAVGIEIMKGLFAKDLLRVYLKTADEGIAIVDTAGKFVLDRVKAVFGK